MNNNIKILHLTSVDITVEKFLIPFLNRLKKEIPPGSVSDGQQGEGEQNSGTD